MNLGRCLLCGVAAAVLLGAGCASTPSVGEAPVQTLEARAFDDASRRFATEVGSLSFRGWPAHVKLTGTPPGPRVRLGTIRNESRVSLDLDAFKVALTRRFTEGGKVTVAPPRGELAGAEEAPEPDLDGDDAAIMAPAEPLVSYLITGSIHDGTSERDGVRRRTLSFDLRLIDMTTMSVALQDRSETSEVIDE